MTVTIRPTSTDRLIVESDGCSDYYGGALVQGATVCRISAPAALIAKYQTDPDGFDLRAFLAELDAGSPYPDPMFHRVCVHERRRVQ